MIKNISKKKNIIASHRVADNMFSRAKGLMFSREKDFDYGLIFDLERETNIGAGIHMFFVFFPINVLFLDANKEIIDIKFELKPWQMTRPRSCKKCRYIIELPIKYGKKFYSVGDKLSW